MPSRNRLSEEERRFQKLPADLRSAKEGEWEAVDMSDSPLKVLEEENFETNFVIANQKTVFQHISFSMKSTLEGIGQEVKTENVFRHMIYLAVNIICICTTQSLVKQGHPRVNELEFLEFIGTKHLRGRFNLSTTEAFKIMDALAVSKGFSLMKQERYSQILSNLRGFDVATREASDEYNEWMEHGVFLHRLENLEKSIFKNSVSNLYRKGGIYVVDDELISSRAGDVERKTISQRKSGKEGPVADVVACSSTSIILGVRLRVAGDTDAGNVKALLETLPKDTTGTQTFDRGCQRIREQVTYVRAYSHRMHPLILEALIEIRIVDISRTNLPELEHVAPMKILCIIQL